jgi:hypothetical protein
MQLSGINGDGSVNLTQAASTALPTGFVVPDAYGLVAPVTKPSLLFDATTGWLAIAGNANNNIVKQTITNRDYYQFDIDGSILAIG